MSYCAEPSYTNYVSIDFGTSGCAIAVGHASPDPKKISVFSAWTEQHKGVHVKQPTILLVNPNGGFEKFGEEAIQAYNQLKMKANDYYLFYRFKMNLYDSPNAKSIQAANGKSLPAINVYAMTLKYLKDTAIEWMDKMFRNPGRRIQWIVTVPAIWSDAAKEIMRKAAEKVELPKESMVFAYEPEAAAMFSRCDFLRDEQSFLELNYLVVDCGGGTVDIAAHKMTKQHGQIYIEELSHPEGGNCGGFAVNDMFEKLIKNILKVPPAQFHQLKLTCSVQWANLINDQFEVAKMTLDPSTPITLSLQRKLCREIEKITGKTMKDLVRNYHDRNVQWDDDDESDIVLYYPAMHNIFKPVLNDICGLIARVLAKSSCKQVNTILLVGGFAESALLFKTIKESFPSINVSRSTTPIHSVVKGAVLCGQHENLIKSVIGEKIKLTSSPPPPVQPMQAKHLPPGASSQFDDMTDTLPGLKISEETSRKIRKYLPPAVAKNLPIVASRKMKYSIGVETVEPFNVRYHDLNRRITQAGETYCARVFYTLVKANENVSIDSPKRSYNFRPLTNEQPNCIISIFASESETVKYIDERGCHNRARVDIHNLPLYNTKLSREIELCINFYNTELEITALCISTRETKKVKVSYEFYPTV